MKTKMMLLTSAVALALFVACKSTTPPTALERTFYTVQTNTIAGVSTNYTLSPNSNASMVGQTAGGIGNLVAPGAGGAIAGIIGTLFAAWGRIRSANSTGTQLVQELETARALIQQLPNGAKYDANFVSWLKAHQGETGVIQNVANLVANTVDSKDAQDVAQEIVKLTTPT